MSQTGASSGGAGKTPEEDHNSIQDPNERRKMQNRIAQRRFREKVRQQREELERVAENQKKAGSSYHAPEPEEMPDGGESGLPWGGLSMRHVVATGKAKEQSSRESSLQPTTTTTTGTNTSQPGGSSRLGLHLIDQYARPRPAWVAWAPYLPAQPPPPPPPPWNPLQQPWPPHFF